MIEQYNIWRKANPHGSIMDFCDQYGYPFSLDIVTEIFSLARVVEVDAFTPEIEVSIKAEIKRVLDNIGEDAIFEIVANLKEEIEENLETIDIDFEYDGYDFTYSYTYNFEARVEDAVFNEFINYKAEQIENFQDFLPSRQERCKQFIMSIHAPKFLKSLSDAIDGGLDINSPFHLTYEGFTFHYDNIEALPGIFYDEQIQGFMEDKFEDFENHIRVDANNPKINNISTHIEAFHILEDLIETYDEEIAMDAIEGIDLESELDDQVMGINQQIMDLIIDGFNPININNHLTAEQFQSIVIGVISDISVDISDHLNNVAIDNGFDSKVIPLEFLGECGANLTSLVHEVVDGFKEKIADLPIRAKIAVNNTIYRAINQELKGDQNYQDTSTRLEEAVGQNDLLNIHRVIAAITHTIDGKYLERVQMPYVYSDLASALEETSHYHKTFVLGNNIDHLRYPSKHPIQSIEEDVSEVFERLQYTGRFFMREIVASKEEPIIASREKEISGWQDKISKSDGNSKLKTNVERLTSNIARYEKEIAERMDKIAKPIPSLKTPNFSVPTFMFTVGYKDGDRNTTKREFLEVPIPNIGSTPVTHTSAAEAIIDVVRERDEQAFKDNIQEQIDSRGLPDPHGYDSERIFSYYIKKPEVIQALVQSLKTKINRDGFLDTEGNTCKIYAATILSYSTNATCRNCTRLYVALANDKTEGSFLDLLTKEIKGTQGLFAYDSSEIKEGTKQREGIRIRSLVVADHDYHEHQKFAKEHPETLVQHGGAFDIKRSDKKSFVEMVRQNVGANHELYLGTSFRSGRGEF